MDILSNYINKKQKIDEKVRDRFFNENRFGGVNGHFSHLY